MKPFSIIKQDVYNDHRDAKSADYQYSLDFKEILYDLSLEDCQFILAVLHKNIVNELEQSNVYNNIKTYEVMERGSEVHVRIHMTNKEETIEWLTFYCFYDTQTKMLDFSISIHNRNNASEAIMIYEYFKNKN